LEDKVGDLLGRCRHSTEVAIVLLIPLAWVQMTAPDIFYFWCCLVNRQQLCTA